jgi:hypothetical protein
MVGSRWAPVEVQFVTVVPGAPGPGGRRGALGYLKDRANTPTGIAYLLGYSEVSAFNRAFRRWTGSTPAR